MPLPQFIRDNTDDGRNIVRFLIDVMEGSIDGAKLSRRLTAARLLVIYQHADASDFIADNSPESEWGENVRATIPPALTRLIRANTDDGRALCLFLIDVMEGRIRDANAGHRVYAAKELLNRAFGKAPSRPLPKPPRSTAPRGPIRKTRQQVAATHTEPVAPMAPTTSADNSTHSSGAAVLTEPAHQTEPEIDGDFDPDVYRAASKCIDPNFDPMLAASDDDYFWSYDGCEDISCPYHGDPEDPDFDPNDYHY